VADFQTISRLTCWQDCVWGTEKRLHNWNLFWRCTYFFRQDKPSRLGSLEVVYILPSFWVLSKSDQRFFRGGLSLLHRHSFLHIGLHYLQLQRQSYWLLAASALLGLFCTSIGKCWSKHFLIDQGDYRRAGLLIEANSCFRSPDGMAGLCWTFSFPSFFCTLIFEFNILLDSWNTWPLLILTLNSCCAEGYSESAQWHF